MLRSISLILATGTVSRRLPDRSKRNRHSSRGNVPARGAASRDGNKIKERGTRYRGEKKTGERGEERKRREEVSVPLRTENVSFRERKACISLRGCALDNGIWGALSSSFRLECDRCCQWCWRGFDWNCSPPAAGCWPSRLARTPGAAGTPGRSSCARSSPRI